MTNPPLCRFCRAPLTRTFLDLGEQPLANSYLTPEQLAAGNEPVFPLHTRVCDRCFLVQADHEVPAEAIFDAGYAYFSSFSSGWVEHARRYAEAMIARFGLGPDSLVVEVASNDGYLLKHFLARGVPVLGVEPTANTAEAARAIGVRTDVVFFNAETGGALAARGDRADLMAANNVLAHVPDLNAFMAGFPKVLKPQGVLTFEFPHLLNLIEKVQFDTIYHEHYSYLSLLAVEQVLRAHGLRPFDVELLATHGGSLRLFCCHEAADHAETEALRALRATEADAGLGVAETYDGFAARVEAVCDSFRAFLSDARDEGRAVAAYGAAAKGNTFLNRCGVTRDDIVEVYDANPAKQGRYLPGSHVPIKAPDAVRTTRPDYVVILPWNLQDEIVRQLAFIGDWGGRFVVASPETRVLD
ncbi:class I SAM-dependent methyltransferase [Phenylobacterium sp. SCN 70-31]|uniref:class I SAM-dependent methyltransferase n=1 Tax=Phenylobacterium sp. SCN 70-31 TaxID=1660129 RepID=UPI00086EA625|nr:class I SAM-dependent methyltransferase [Phenylobacterium sp. SCN 70-31]ODT86877.1 MAG: SAM-dependent methyltransferase [Phenylobacterium sp. SCN 70-31]